MPESVIFLGPHCRFMPFFLCGKGVTDTPKVVAVLCLPFKVRGIFDGALVLGVLREEVFQLAIMPVALFTERTWGFSAMGIKKAVTIDGVGLTDPAGWVIPHRGNTSQSLCIALR